MHILTVILTEKLPVTEYFFKESKRANDFLMQLDERGEKPIRIVDDFGQSATITPSCVTQAILVDFEKKSEAKYQCSNIQKIQEHRGAMRLQSLIANDPVLSMAQPKTPPLVAA